jgi:hypothetical protein
VEEPGPTIDAEEVEPDPDDDESLSSPRTWLKAGGLLAAAAVLQAISEETGLGLDGELLLLGVFAVFALGAGFFWFLRGREERPLDQLAEMQREAEAASSRRRSA